MCSPYPILAVLFTLALPLAAQRSWTPLITGEGLDGWETHGGNATYELRDGVIVGKAVANSPNTFLTTKESYGDFIFEGEVYLPNALNSGIMFRAQLRPEDDRVFGYQYEIDPSARAWTGGIYDEARRRWVYPLSLNEPARDAFRIGAWNDVRIEAYGDRLHTYVNGELAARLVDDLDAEGVFGLQVHGIDGGQGSPGDEVRWRELRIHTDSVEHYLRDPDPQVRQVSYLKNELTDYERRHGWRLLWDGETTEGWRGAKLDDFPASGWTIDDGVLTIAATDGGESTGPGDIVTERHYADFELVFDFAITEGANSGVKYFVDPALNKGAGSAIGCEFQILDDERHPDAKAGVLGNRTLGSLYDLIPAANADYGRRKQVNGPGSWNRGRIVSRDGHVEHWLNGEKVVEYDRHSQTFAALVNYSKYRDWENFGRWPAGAILLQDHGDRVSFRSIKIREF